MTRVTGDVLAIEDFVINSLAGFAMAVFLLIGTVIYLVYHSWQAALIALLLIPLLALVTLYFSRRIAALAVVQRRNEGGLASATQEMLTSIRLIQTYGSAEYEQSRFAGQNEVRMSSTLARARLQAQFTWVMSVLQALAIAAIIWLGLWLVGRSTITVGTLVLFVMLIQNMFKPLRRIIKEWNRLGKVYACVERIGDLIDRVPAVANAPDARVAPHLEGRVEFRQVSFKYGHAGESGPGETSTPHEARMALKQVSLTVGPGEVLALVGPTGAGKSSVIQLLPRLYDPTTGQILLDEQDIRTFTLDSLRRQMSMVLQETILFNGTVAENIAYAAPHISREQIIVAAQAANAHEFIERLPDGYDTILSERGANLSGGQRQRIAIARAFIRDTPILILDEPTTGLDAAATDTVMAALRRLMPGKTTILVSHDFNLIREATKILVIEDGTIVETGTHASLLKSHGLYADLYHRQFSASAATPSDLVAQPA
jgi:ABC-type multidrug transport system fused ATPase/permease subunit